MELEEKSGQVGRSDLVQRLSAFPAILPNLELPWGDRVMASDEDSPTPPPQNRKLVK